MRLKYVLIYRFSKRSQYIYSGVHKITRVLFRVLKYSANNFSHTIVYVTVNVNERLWIQLYRIDY